MIRGPVAFRRMFVAVATLVACSSGRIVDNWGPPAGYAVLRGKVSQTSGAPAAKVEVAFSRCASPVGGFLASTTTDAAGQFRVEAQLPPQGVLPSGIADTLRLRCDVFLDRSGVARDSVWVRFAATAQEAPTTIVDLVAP